MTLHDDEIRQWAYGYPPREAATEILLRTVLRGDCDLGVRTDERGVIYLDFDEVFFARLDFPDREHHVIEIAYLLYQPCELVELGHCLLNLGREYRRIVLAGFAHAVGELTIDEWEPLLGVDDEPSQ